MIENLTKDLQLSGTSKGFTKSPAHKPEVPVLTQAEMESFYSNLTKCKTKPVVKWRNYPRSEVQLKKLQKKKP